MNFLLGDEENKQRRYFNCYGEFRATNVIQTLFIVNFVSTEINLFINYANSEEEIIAGTLEQEHQVRHLLLPLCLKKHVFVAIFYDYTILTYLPSLSKNSLE